MARRALRPRPPRAARPPRRLASSRRHGPGTPLPVARSRRLLRRRPTQAVVRPGHRVDVEKAEHRLGRPLPELLRRVYTEVGDGGFGPDSGIASLRRNNRAPGHTHDWPCAVRERTGRARDREPPPSWLFLTDCGCTVETRLSLTAIDSPVLVYDADWWKPERGQGPHDAVHYAMPPRRWLSIWANGGDVWEHLSADTSQVADTP
ncbi:SMI1/KNR4 family protein [Yinghuangia aomiensis]